VTSCQREITIQAHETLALGCLGAVLPVALAAGLAGCFSDDNGAGIDAAFPGLDSATLDVQAGPDTTTTTEAAVEAGVDAPVDSTLEASPEAAPEQQACGTSCVDCAGNQVGSACVNTGNGYACGCTGAADCPVGYACNTRVHQCTTACIVGLWACNGGCCQTSATAGASCVAGTANDACGTNGGMCADCTATPATPTCNASGMCQ